MLDYAGCPCRICGKVVNLFNDENHWFMEA